jgi:hypothetical protein
MSPIFLTSILAALQGLPCLIGVLQTSDRTTRALGILLVLLDIVIGLRPYVDLVARCTPHPIGLVLALAAAMSGLIVAVRLAHQVIATLIIVAGVLLAAVQLGLVR